jgi:hypothetical protein
MNTEIATLVRQEQLNDFIRETTHNPERTMTMNAKHLFVASLIALVLVLGTIVTVAPRGGANWGSAPDTSAPSQFACLSCGGSPVDPNGKIRSI